MVYETASKLVLNKAAPGTVFTVFGCTFLMVVAFKGYDVTDKTTSKDGTEDKSSRRYGYNPGEKGKVYIGADLLKSMESPVKLSPEDSGALVPADVVTEKWIELLKDHPEKAEHYLEFDFPKWEKALPKEETGRIELEARQIIEESKKTKRDS